ncbi:helix-turn-helix domain-containing protein [Aureibacter tunicatorum]|uniref:AraC family transcriptional activator of pobA n=1 Tax=Aureibacter tunicatorum TaxID=866807 RepID=A0AAE3XJJ2_9BACT|nr:helix-turn-helix domain-containing protein [Aureibacter tunicatorum]MDR6237299.1 AraC family transcriptional activator of pobA [Aureibacter tunicatorum]BDD06290.1 AraC family transcriptional regulator [Aureibacter tunicatorum]
MKSIKFNKTICGVDFLLNILDNTTWSVEELTSEVQKADFFQIAFIEEGTGFIELESSKLEVVSGSAIFISMNQTYRWIVDPKCFKARILVFQEDFLNEFFADKLFSYRLNFYYQPSKPSFLKLDDDFFIECMKMLKEISQELILPKNDSSHVIRALLYYLLMKINREYAEFYGLKESISIDNTAYEFRRMLEDNIQKCQRVEEYAEMMNISRVSLNNAVKKQFGLTAIDLIKRRLLEEVKELLIHTTLTIGEISDKLSFSEPNHLARFFKRYESMTPSEFRVAYENGSL